MSAVHRWSSPAVAVLVLASSATLAPVPAVAVPQDSSPPEVVSFAFVGDAPDVTSEERAVIALARVTDAGSGVMQPVFAELWSDTAPQVAGEASVRRVSGDAHDGTYELTWTLAHGAAPGSWTAGLYAMDAAGNETLPEPGGPGTAALTVVNRGEADVVAPEVVELEVVPAVVDVRTADQRVTLRARIVDAGTGVVAPFVDAWMPDAGIALDWGELRRTSGTAQDGWWEWSITVPRGTMPGSWRFDIWGLRDAQGNLAWPDDVPFDSAFEVGYSPSSDVTGPRVESLTVTPALIDADDPFATVTVRAHVTDADAGVVPPEVLLTPESMPEVDAGARARLERPAAALAAPDGERGAPADDVDGDDHGYAEYAQLELVSGTPNDGIYEWTGPVGGAAEFPGRWTVALEALRDYAGNFAERGQRTATFSTTPTSDVVRLAGPDRFATAAAVAARFPTGVETVYVASGATFPDALAGAALAGREGAPILLALPDRVPDATLAALERLDPERVVVLGGPPTLSEAVADQLSPYGQVSRIAGADRFETGALIADRFEGADTVYVASGSRFPDALAGAAVAGATGSPVLLTDAERLPSTVAMQLERLEPSRIVLLGGTPSVSAAVEAQLRPYGDVERVAGADRFETAAMVAAELDHVDRVLVASGASFPDALAGAALAGAQGAPVLLALRDDLPPSTQAAIEAAAPRQVVVLGDANAISIRVADGMAALLR